MTTPASEWRLPGSSQRPLRFYIAHSAATGNVGDDAMLMQAMNRLRRTFPGCDLLVPRSPGGKLPEGLPRHEVVPDIRTLLFQAMRATAPLRVWHRRPDVDDPTGGPAVRWRRLAADLAVLSARSMTGRVSLPGLAALRHSDVLYVTGDNALNHYNPAGIFERSSLCQIAAHSGVKVVLSAQGIGPLDQPWAVDELRRILSVVDLLSFRDHHNGLNLCARLAPVDLWRAVVGDEAFGLPSSSPAEASAALRGADLPEDEPFIAVHFRQADFTSEPCDLVNGIASLLDAVASRRRESFVFFPMSYEKRYGLDEAYAHAISSAMSHSNRLRVLRGLRSPSLAKACIGRSRLTLGSSYHLHVFGLSQNVPAVVAYSGAYYASKSCGLVDFYGPPNVAIDMKLTPPSEIAAAAMAALEHETAAASIAETNSRLNEVNESHLLELRRRLIAERGTPISATQPGTRL